MDAMGVLRTSLAIALCLLLGVTGQAMAFARGAAPAEDRVVICAGHVYKVVYVDAEGQPTAPPELCADCLLLLTALGAPREAAVRPDRFEIALLPAPYRTHNPGAVARDYTARAPPVL